MKSTARKRNSHKNTDKFDSTQADPALVSVIADSLKTPILILKIDMEDGNFEDFKIYTHSNLQNLSLAFCRKHNLSDEFAANLMEFVSQQLENLKRIVPSKKTKKKKRRPQVKKIYERLWYDATQGQKYREMLNQKKFEILYPFQPNTYKSQNNSTLRTMRSTH